MEEDQTGVEQPSESQRRSGAAFDRMVGNSTSAAFTALVTTYTGSPESGAFVGGLLGPLAEELSFALRKIATVRNSQAEAMVHAAAEQAELTVAELIEGLLNDPVSMQLLVVGLEAAGRATNEAKLRLISSILAAGAPARDDAVIDEQLLAMEAVRELDTPHFRLMLIMSKPGPVYWDEAHSRQRFEFAWPETHIIETDSGLRNALPNLVAKLQSLGLARSVSIADETNQIWTLTTFGKTCIEFVREDSEFNEGL